MNSKKLRDMLSAHDRGVKGFAEYVDIPYTTLVSSIKTDTQLERMPIENFKKVAKGLGMNIDELDDLLSE